MALYDNMQMLSGYLLEEKNNFFSLVNSVSKDEDLINHINHHLRYIGRVFESSLDIEHMEPKVQIRMIEIFYERNDFWTHLDVHKSFEDRLKHVVDSTYDIQGDGDLDYLFGQFHINDFGDAMKLAQAFKRKFGTVMIWMGNYRLSNKILTVLDCLHEELVYALRSHIRETWLEKEIDDNHRRRINKFKMLIDAFEKAGFIRYHNFKGIDTLLASRIIYEVEGLDAMTNSVDYEFLRSRNQNLCRELQEYLWSPKRVEKWIMEGNEIEDYFI